MNIGDQVRVQLASGEWYLGRVTGLVPYFQGETRFEVQGKHPRPFVTITRRSNLVAAQESAA